MSLRSSGLRALLRHEQAVARMKRSEIRGLTCILAPPPPHCASLHAGYGPAPSSATSAWARSATRSSGCSMPIESRIVASETPMRARSAAGTPECVVGPGWQASDSVPAGLTAGLEIGKALGGGDAAAIPALMSGEEGDRGAVR